MSKADFINQLREIGYHPEERGDGRIIFPYLIQVGKFMGKEIRLGLILNDDFPLNPPGGPHLSPRLLPINTAGGPHPAGQVHESPFGPDWEYWSRPYPTPPGWANTDRKVRTYMAHITNLFVTQ